jgi:hypothetical protein
MSLNVAGFLARHYHLDVFNFQCCIKLVALSPFSPLTGPNFFIDRAGRGFICELYCAENSHPRASE